MRWMQGTKGRGRVGMRWMQCSRGEEDSGCAECNVLGEEEDCGGDGYNTLQPGKLLEMVIVRPVERSRTKSLRVISDLIEFGFESTWLPFPNFCIFVHSA